ncbi:hypothetical protein P0D75_18360 [Paraburkholderia sediminicola]|uniref:hypothetical protein n=1 Tax=Paraburkholderia sediminicola TaxID=458836 RepID=UPI0038BDFF0F
MIKQLLLVMALAGAVAPFASLRAQSLPPPPPPDLSLLNSPPKTVVMVVHLDDTMDSKNALQTMNECLHDDDCKNAAAVVAAAVSYGYGAAVVYAAAEIQPVRQEGEEAYYTYKLPDGYRYCRMHIETGSMVPRVGDRSPVMGVAAQGDSVGVYAWVPKGQMGQGHTWIEATFTITGVRSDLASTYRQNALCTADESHKIVDCRGSGPNQNDSTRPPCTQFDDAPH